ncbi:MAG: hypothetical protein ACNS62_03395 [Candidatus Cyclobacteriaceae bacterium M3_2C_046]
MSESSHLPEKLPLYRKGKEIYELTYKITELIPDDEEMQVQLKRYMLEDAVNLSVKVAGAEAADLYDIRMECAAIIRKSGRDLMAHCSGLEAFDFKDSHYLYLIREALEEYREMFAQWVKSFDPWNYIIDRWGLFNPPGINYDDIDPDEDLE